ncbi:alternative NAD(P)H-ubiquinone oxidoreductase C1, chloroplastic/mitochondrial isoform X2 [Brassica rapa]|uniref:alternative NAD(P)H-ubiquinone oxidoreductase C1, chloroplastic/mitochondrial isoform X2 n=1 Tax=Brassica campestris TaxID=3711 RepID=UPI00142E3D89|nr:alternative NAD(P)H-ubiquinone oxidoreductase C1, chloroplastic/mitochondrial isoform X2 [Brassica rapa]
MALLSAVSSLLPFSYGATRLSSKASLASTTSGFNLSSLRNSPRNPLRLYVSRAIADNGGYTEVSEIETPPPRTYTWPDNKRPRVCILGGGFGGLYTALRLESLVWPDDKKPQVVLVDQSERFVFKPMLYELLSGARLVLALGAEPKLDLVPGAMEFALPFYTLNDAIRVNEKLSKLERRNFKNGSAIKVAVVGCGYGGVELAATISERLQDRGTVQAINVSKSILTSAPDGNREAAMKVLASRKVELLLGYLVRCIKRATDSEEEDGEGGYMLELEPTEKGVESQVIEADMVLWTVGTKPLLTELEQPSGGPSVLPLNVRGQAETDETLRVKGHPRIFALGDSSSLRDSNGKLLPTTAQVAFQEADFTGWNIWAAINNRPLLPFRFQNLGEMMTLGRYDAAISPSFIEGLTLDGPVGHAARKLAYLIRLPTDEHRFKVGVSWFAKSAVESVALLQSNLAKVFSSS